jgi:3-hydroxy-9,10-secoandrosta-1,3,5(10)-triene-9,17-dione monooxygenase reductase component
MVTTGEFRHILGHFATGVTVITTRDADGIPRGFIANAFTSLSLDPPLVVVCVDKRSQTYPALQADGAVFAVNILSRDQESISRHFASKHPDKFALVDYASSQRGVPILHDVLAFLECRVVERFDGGDHTILVGAVHNLGALAGADPLLFYRGVYTSTTINPCPPARSEAGREEDRAGRVLQVASA